LLIRPCAILRVFPLLSLKQLLNGGKVVSSSLDRYQSDPDSPLYMSHTSGTTGEPKTFIFSHNQFVCSTEKYREYLNWSSGDRFYLNMSMGDPTGCALCLSLMHLGMTIVLAGPGNIVTNIKNIRKNKIDCAIFLPWKLRQFLKYRSTVSVVFPGMKSLMSYSSLLHPNEKMLVRNNLTPNFSDEYGTTEFWWISAATPEQQIQYAESVGKPFEGVDVQVVDQNHQPVAAGVTGLIRVKTDNMITQYYQNPEATKQHFKDGYFYPMDLGYLNEKGFLFLQGRTDGVIEYKGAKFYPYEVTNCLSGFPGVDDAFVFPWPDQGNGQVAAAALATSRPVSQVEIDRYCRQMLASYKVPRHYLFINPLPKNRSGKVNVPDLINALRNQLSSK